MSSAPVLCRVSYENLGVPPSCGLFEARQLSEGFEVSFRDERLCPEGEIIATCDIAYSARAFALIIVNFEHSTTLCKDTIWENVRPTVTVVGERGIRAQLLQYATKGGWPRFWLERQSEAALDLLDPLVGDLPPDDSWQNAIEHAMYYATLFGYQLDTIALLRRYDLPLSLDRLPALNEAVDRDLAARGAERQARVAPFRREIDAIKMKFSDDDFRWCLGRTARWVIAGFLENYVVEHGQMPQGKMWVEHQGTWPNRTGGRSIGMVDFDKLATVDRWRYGQVD